MHRPPRGVTLIELLVVVAIIGLIVAAILVGLFPSDDRRVKGEAERLAAYLEAAGAEAKMNEGPVRVELALTDGEYHRQAAKVGAKLAERLWKDDDSARPDRIKAPVQLAAVLMGGAVEMTSGTAWLLWEDTRTAGGVAVLQLNEAVWSVVVDPNTGAVKVERGRSAVPAATEPLRRSLRPDVAAALGGDGATASALSGGSLLGKGLQNFAQAPAAPERPGRAAEAAPESSPPELPPAEPTPPEDPPEAPQAPQPTPSFDAGVDFDASLPDSGPLDAAQPEPDAEQGQCVTDSDCPAIAGFRQACVVGQSMASARCYIDPRGRTFKVRRFTLGGQLADTPFASAFNDQLASLFDAETYRLFVRFDPEGSRNATPGPNAAYNAWIVQDAYEGGGGNDGLRQYSMTVDAAGGVGTRTARARARVPTGADASGTRFSIEFMPLDRSRQGWGPRLIELFPQVTRLVAGEAVPCYYRFSALLGGFVEVDASGGDVVHTLRVASCFEDRELRKYRLTLPDGRSLDALTIMSELVPNPDCDTNDDGDLDGRTLALDGALIEVGLDGDATRFTSTMPAPLCPDQR